MERVLVLVTEARGGIGDLAGVVRDGEGQLLPLRRVEVLVTLGLCFREVGGVFGLGASEADAV